MTLVCLLGHTDLKTTEIYARVSIRQLKQIHSATHPARLAPSSSHTDESARAELLSTLDAEAEEDNEAENRL